MKTIFYYLLTFSSFITSAAQGKTAAQTWDLKDLYQSKRAWTSAIANLEKELKTVDSCRNKLSESPTTLQNCLEKMSKISMELSRIYTWAGLQVATDQLSPDNIEQQQIASSLARKVSAELSFVNPELAKIKQTTLDKFFKKKPDLKTYKQYLRNVKIQAKHILSKEEEKIVSTLQPMTSDSRTVYGMLMNADIEYQTIKLNDGSKVVADAVGYGEVRDSQNRSDREKVFQAFYNTLKQYERTFGLTLYQSIQSRTTLAKLRNYPNALSAALGSEQIPQDVYRNLVKQVENNLPILHRYLKLKKKLLGLKSMKYYDLYPSVQSHDVDYTLEKSREDLLKAIKPLGQDYFKRFEKASSQKWVDALPRKGKRSGAFMNGSAYEVHPYVLLNHQNNYYSSSTYAHEWGHALHTLLTNKEQAYQNSNYATFVAETAAILNEVLLLEYKLQNAKNEDERLYFLSYAMEFLRTAFFRQTLFSQFELKLHEAVENGEALSGAKISEIYGTMLKKYYGHDQGVVEIDPIYHTEWAFVHHFYYGFYVYTYSTSIAAAYNFASKILSGDKKTLDKYLKLLEAGGSKYPHELFIDAGIDMTKAKAYEDLKKKADTYLDQIEDILKKKQSS